MGKKSLTKSTTKKKTATKKKLQQKALHPRRLLQKNQLKTPSPKRKQTLLKSRL